MVDLGQKKVDSHPPFFMLYSENKAKKNLFKIEQVSYKI